MAKSSPAILSLNAGELSPRLDGRTDLEKYSKGCRTLRNFLPLVQGGVTKRVGTRFLMEAPSARRLVPFVFNAADSFVLVFYPQKIEFYQGHTPVFSGSYTATGASKTNPVVITVASTAGLSNGDSVFIDVLTSGMTQLARRRFTVKGLTGTTFQLYDPTGIFPVNGTSYDTFASGFTVWRIYSLATPFDAAGADVDALQFAQQNDVVYMACPTHAPMKLSRFAADDWTIEEVPFKHFPFSPENLDEQNFVAATTSLSTTQLLSSAGIFTPSMVGSYVKLREIAEAYNPEWAADTDLDLEKFRAFQANATTFQAGDRIQYEGRVYEMSRRGTNGFTGSAPPTHDSGFASDGLSDWEFINYGYGYARIIAVNDAYSASATVIVPFPKSTLSFLESCSASATNPIVITTGTAHDWETGDKVFFRALGGTFGTALNNTLQTITRTGSTTFTVAVNGTGLAGASGQVYRLYAAANATGLNGRIYPSMFRWSFGAWDAVRGYPRAVSFYEDRLLWAGTTSNPQTCWASRPGRYEDHATFDDDDSALTFTLSTSDPIAWIRDNSGLVIGTAGSEFSTERNAAEPLSAETVNTIRQRSQYGSRLNVAPMLIENVIVFLQSRGLKLRELVYDDTQGSLVASDLMRLADHLTGAGLVKELAFAGEPFRTLWCVLENQSGIAKDLLGFTYERDEQVYAWHRHSFGGSFCFPVSAAVIPHPLGDQDSTLLLIQRSIDGSARRYVERITGRVPANNIPRREDPLSWFYADSHVIYSDTSTTTISGLMNWAGETLQVLGPDGYMGEFTVSATGKITLPTAVTDAIIGYGMNCVASPMRIESGSQDGTAQGKTKRAVSLRLRLMDTGRGLYMGPTEETATEEVVIADGALKSGDTDLLPWPGGWETDGIIVLKHDKPTPCEITSIMVRMVTSD